MKSQQFRLNEFLLAKCGSLSLVNEETSKAVVPRSKYTVFKGARDGNKAGKYYAICKLFQLHILNNMYVWFVCQKKTNVLS